MTPQFERLLQQVPSLSAATNQVFGIALGCAILVALWARYAGSALGLITAVALAAAYISGERFLGWWNRLVDVAATSEDRRWLLDHDGGRLIVYLSIFLKSAGVWLLASAVYGVRRALRTRKRQWLQKRTGESTGTSLPTSPT
jgi:hypothetical protein